MITSIDDLPENWTSLYTSRSFTESEPERECEICGKPTGDERENLCEDCWNKEMLATFEAKRLDYKNKGIIV